MIEPDRQRADLALVLVCATSPFLPHSVLDRREGVCVELATDVAARTDVVRRADRTAAGVVELLRRRLDGSPAGTVVITWSVFDLVGSGEQLAVLRRLLDRGVVVYEVVGGRLVPADAGRLDEVRPVRAGPHGDERRRHSMQTREGRRDTARDGRFLGGRRPLGWMVDEAGEVTLDLVAAAHIRSATVHVADGGSVGAVVATWNAAGFATVTGRAWVNGSARRVILRARNAGLVEYRGAIVGRSQWPAIVSVRDWTRARDRLDAPRKRKSA